MIKKILSSNKKYYIKTIFFQIIYCFMILSIPKLITYQIDNIQNSDISYVFITTGIVILSSIMRYFNRYYLIYGARKIELDLRNTLFYQIMHNLNTSQKSGQIFSIIYNDVNIFRFVIGANVGALIDILFFSIFGFIMITSNSSIYMTAVIYFPIIVIGLLAYTFEKLLRKDLENIQSIKGELNDILINNFSNLRQYKVLWSKEQNDTEFNKINYELLEKQKKSLKIKSIFEPLIYFINSLEYIIAIVLGSILINLNIITIGELISSLLYISILTTPILSLGWFLNNFFEYGVVKSRISDIEVSPDSTEETYNISEESLNTIEACELEIIHENKNILLKSNFEIKPNDKIAIMSPMGKGKTSLLETIAGVNNNFKGDIVYNNTSINRLSKHFIQNNCTFVPTNPILLDGSIYDNINLLLNFVNKNKLRAYLNKYKLDDLNINRDQVINISEGQKQRVAMIRALLKESSIYFIDDALNSIDINTRQKIFNDLLDLNATVLYSTNNIEEAMKMDKILLIRDKKIISLDKSKCNFYENINNLLMEKEIKYYE